MNCCNLSSFNYAGFLIKLTNNKLVYTQVYDDINNSNKIWVYFYCDQNITESFRIHVSRSIFQPKIKRKNVMKERMKSCSAQWLTCLGIAT